MVKSAIQNDKCCYICRRNDVERHHCLHGSSNRKNADKYKLTVWLCHEHHMQLHRERELDLFFIRLAQVTFEKTHTREEFIAIFGKNWL